VEVATMDQATGARLRAAREERGAAPDDVAAAVGIPPEAVTDIEQGEALRHYGPGLAAAWTWAVGRHLGVAIDHELATWQPPEPGERAAGGRAPVGEQEQPNQPAQAPESHAQAGSEHTQAGSEHTQAGGHRQTGEEPGGGTGSALDAPGSAPAYRPDDQPDVMPPTALGDGVDDELSGAVPTESEGADGAEPDGPAGGWREPTVEPGWLAGHDRDPGDAQDPFGHEPSGWDTAAWDAGSDTAGREAAEPGGGDEPAPPASVLEADQERDPFAGERGRGAADPGDTQAWPPPEEDLWGPEQSPPVPPDDTQQPGGVPNADETGELPASETTQMLSYTEGDEAPPLEAPSRLRTTGVVLAAMVVLVGAGVGVGTLAAQLLDAPGEGAESVDGEPAAGEEPATDAETEDVADPDGEDAEPDEPAVSDDGEEADDPLASGDAAAAADPAEVQVQVLDGAADNARYADALGLLEDLGYRVVASGPAASAYEKTTVFVTDGHADEAAGLAEADDRFAQQRPNDVGLNEEVELHVIVGDDWPDPEGG
jgi:transcriptional regulator with XRE-family HTH domain